MERRTADPAGVTDVLIVGAGPVGLFLANECARRGLRSRIIETRASQSAHSRALAIFPRTLEIFDMAGLVSPFLEAANRVTSVALQTHGRTLARLRFTPPDTPYPFVAMVPQNVTERLLVSELQRRGSEVDYETTFVSARQQADSVLVQAEHRGTPISLRASFVVGCDGAHSAVRHCLNIPFAGAQYAALFLLADIETNTILPADELQLCPSESGPVAIFPMSATRRRIVASVEKPVGDAPSLELVRGILAQRAPPEIEARSLHWSSYFKIHHRHVAKLASGRVFIAGDAAHIHSPFGGQGMNTGLQDVWNLAWKLDLFLHGHGNQELLESYSIERLPIIKSVIGTTDRLTKIMGASSRLAQMLRDAFIPMVSRLPPLQHAFVQRLSELGIAYGGSPLVKGAGERWLEDSMRGGDGIRNRFLLLVGEGTHSVTRQAAQALCGTVSDIAELRMSPRPGVTLVRPDGYVAYSGSDRADGAAIRSIRSLLARQTHDRSNLIAS